MSEDLTDILIAPYLILPNGLEVGPWRFVPFGHLEESEALPADLRGQALDLVDAYRVDGGPTPVGAVVYPADGQIGTSFDRSEIKRLHKALLVGVIANNPKMAASEDDQPDNAGHMAMTAENALLYGHPTSETRSYVIESGAIVREISLRTARDGEDLPKVAPPVGLSVPLLANFDEEMAEAVFEVLGRDDIDARRLSRTLDWCELCFSNAVEISRDVRIMALRSAFEALTGASDETKKVVRAVEEMLRDDSTETVTYQPFWAKGPVQGTPDGMWMTRFSDLRNEITHGHEISPGLWEHDGFGQQLQALDRLLLGLKSFLARATENRTLRMPHCERKLMQA